MFEELVSLNGIPLLITSSSALGMTTRWVCSMRSSPPGVPCLEGCFEICELILKSSEAFLRGKFHGDPKGKRTLLQVQKDLLIFQSSDELKSTLLFFTGLDTICSAMHSCLVFYLASFLC